MEKEKKKEEMTHSYNYCYADKFDMEDIETNRHLFLNGDVDEQAIDQLVYHILRYNRLDKGKPVEDRQPIVLYINSPGGSVICGYGLIDAIISSKTPVYTVNLAECSSMGFLIAIAGHKRYTFPHCEYLMHEGYAGAYDNMSKAKDRIDFEAGEMEEMTRAFVLSKTKITEDLYKEKYRCEWYFLPAKAKELGVVDYIVGVDCDIDEII